EELQHQRGDGAPEQEDLDPAQRLADLAEIRRGGEPRQDREPKRQQQQAHPPPGRRLPSGRQRARAHVPHVCGDSSPSRARYRSRTARRADNSCWRTRSAWTTSAGARSRNAGLRSRSSRPARSRTTAACCFLSRVRTACAASPESMERLASTSPLITEIPPGGRGAPAGRIVSRLARTKGAI